MHRKQLFEKHISGYWVGSTIDCFEPIVGFLMQFCFQKHGSDVWVSRQCTEVRFARFLSGEFTTMAVINPPERKLVKRTSVQCLHTPASQPDYTFGPNNFRSHICIISKICTLFFSQPFQNLYVALIINQKIFLV